MSFHIQRIGHNSNQTIKNIPKIILIPNLHLVRTCFPFSHLSSLKVSSTKPISNADISHTRAQSTSSTHAKPLLQKKVLLSSQKNNLFPQIKKPIDIWLKPTKKNFDFFYKIHSFYVLVLPIFLERIEYSIFLNFLAETIY